MVVLLPQSPFPFALPPPATIFVQQPATTVAPKSSIRLSCLDDQASTAGEVTTTALVLSRPEACISALPDPGLGPTFLSRFLSLSPVASKTMGLLSIIRKNKRKEKEMRILMV
jgi:hypothetical protein